MAHNIYHHAKCGNSIADCPWLWKKNTCSTQNFTFQFPQREAQKWCFWILFLYLLKYFHLYIPGSLQSELFPMSVLPTFNHCPIRLFPLSFSLSLTSPSLYCSRTCSESLLKLINMEEKHSPFCFYLNIQIVITLWQSFF